MSEDERNLLASVARAILSGDRGKLANQLDWPYPEPQFHGGAAAAAAPPGSRPGRR